MITGPLVEAIGWALLHLIWQGALVAAILGAALALLRRQSANTRYLASCAALLLIVALAVATAYREYEPASAVEAAALARSEAPAASFLGPTSADDSFLVLAFVTTHLPEIVAIWFVGVLILSIRLVVGWVGAHRLASRRSQAATGSWERSLVRIAEVLGLRRPIRLLQSAAVEVPTVIGWVRPVVLLPVATLSGLSVGEIEMILAHELAHIRRHDFVVNLMQSVLETLLFYHPAVWWISRRIRVEREHCCDDLAVGVFGDPLRYAHALTRFEELRINPQSMLAANGGSLLVRIRRLVSAGAETSNWPSRWAAGAALLTVLAVVLAAPSLPLFAAHEPQSAPPPPPAVTAPPAAPAPAPTPAPTPAPSVQPKPAKCDDALLPDIEVDVEAPEPPEPPLVAPRIHVKPLMPIDSQPMLVDIERSVRASIANGIEGGVMGGILGGIDLKMQTKPRHKIGKSGKLTVDDLITLRTARVTPEYIEQMRAAGLRDVSLDELVELRMTGVTPEYVKEMNASGHRQLTAHDLVQLRMQGITPAFVKSLAEAGYTDLSVHDLLRLRMSGIDAEFIRELQKYRTK